MNVRCINSSNYRITVGTEYTVVREEERYYFIVNDNNRNVRYSKDLFEEVVQEVIAPRTEQDMINSLTVTSTMITGDPFVNVRYTDIQNEVITVNIPLNQMPRLGISCGIKEYSGLNGLLTRIMNAVPQDDDYERLTKEIFRNIIRILCLNDNRAITLFSTVENTNNVLTSVFEEFEGFVTERKMNPNSHNYIIMWGVYSNFEEGEEEDED